MSSASSPSSFAISLKDVQDAAARIKVKMCFSFKKSILKLICNLTYNASQPYAAVTPVMTCHTLDQLSGRQLFFKCENLQKVSRKYFYNFMLKLCSPVYSVFVRFFLFFATLSCWNLIVFVIICQLLFAQAGAFKFRGACNSIMQLTEEECKRGVVCQLQNTSLLNIY